MEQTKSIVEIQKEITVGIQSFEARKQELIKMASDYSLLDIKDHTDKVGYKQVDEARKQLKKERVLIEKEAKILRNPLREITALVSAKEKELIELTEPLEKSLAEKQKKYDDENAAIEAAKQKEKQEKLQYMIDQLAAYNVPIVVADLQDISDEEFKYALYYAKVEYDKAEAIKAEAERIENERIAKEKEEADKLAKELQDLREKQEAADKIQKEKEAKDEAERKAKQAELITQRSATLSQQGMIFNGSTYSLLDASISYVQLSTYQELEWNDLLCEILPLVELRKKQQEELAAQRIKDAEILAAENERQRIAEEQAKEELIKKQKAEIEAEELAAASDKQKWISYINGLKGVETHQYRSGQFRKKAKIALEKLEEIFDL